MARPVDTERLAWVLEQLALLRPESEIVADGAKNFGCHVRRMRASLKAAKEQLLEAADLDPVARRAQMLVVYMDLYGRAHKAGHWKTCHGVADSICRLFGLDGPQKVEFVDGLTADGSMSKPEAVAQRIAELLARRAQSKAATPAPAPTTPATPKPGDTN